MALSLSCNGACRGDGLYLHRPFGPPQSSMVITIGCYRTTCCRLRNCHVFYARGTPCLEIEQGMHATPTRDLSIRLPGNICHPLLLLVRTNSLGGLKHTGRGD
jgi:hypothetical protein